MKKHVVVIFGLMILPYILVGEFITDIMGYGHWLEPFDDVLEIMEIMRNDT